MDQTKEPIHEKALENWQKSVESRPVSKKPYRVMTGRWQMTQIHLIPVRMTLKILTAQVATPWMMVLTLYNSVISTGFQQNLIFVYKEL